MLGTMANMSFMEASFLCPALLSLIKPVPPIGPGLLSLGATPKPVFYNLEELLQRPECAHTISNNFDSIGNTVPNSPLAVLLKNSGSGYAASQAPVYGGGVATQAIPANLLSPEMGGQPRSTEHTSMLSGFSRMEEDEEDEYWPTHIRLIMSVIFVVLSVVGIVGNILVVVVVNKVPGMISPTNCYLVSLAISDCMFFVAAAPTELSYLHVASSKYIFGQFGCLIFSYLPYLAINTSSMSITAFTVERFIAICYPLRARYICTVKRAKIIIFFIWIFCILYNSPWLYLATLKEDTAHGQQCTFKLTRDNWTYKVMFLGDFSAFYLIPMILYVFIYGKITYTLSRCGLKCPEKLRSREALSAAIQSPDKGTTPPLNTTVTQKANVKEYIVSSGNRKSSTKGKVQVIKMLAVVVFIFAVCWLPYRAMVMWNSFTSSSKWDPDWYIFLSKTMIFFNCSVNPILYNMMSLKFRNAFKRLFVERGKANGLKGDSWISPNTVLSLKTNRNKPNGTTGFGIRSATANATTVTMDNDDADSPRILSESCALVQTDKVQISPT